MNLGNIYTALGTHDQALASTLKSLELKPNNPTAHMNLGNIYKDLRNLDQALASTLKSLELKPDNPTALMNLGVIYKDLGNPDQALASTLKSLELKPDNPDALVSLLNMNTGGDLEDVKNIAVQVIKKRNNIVNDLNFVEAISCLGEKFATEALIMNKSSNQ